MKAAEALGVRGTPHFFLGRIKDGNLVTIRALSGAQPVSSFRSAIDALLAQRESAAAGKR